MHRTYDLKPKPPKWTKEKCIKNALKFNTIKEWVKSSGTGYWAAQRNYWLPECTAHMKRLPRGRPLQWDLVSCRREAAKYTSRLEWQQSSVGSYSSAQANGWLDLCFSSIDGKELHAKITPPVNPLTENDIFDIIENEFNKLLGNNKCLE